MSEDNIKKIVQKLMFSKNDYITDDELREESIHWEQYLHEIEISLNKLGLDIKRFKFENKICFSVVSDNDIGESLSDIQSYILIDFMIRYELFNKENKVKGITRTKWRENLNKIISTNEFSANLKELVNKNILIDTNKYVKPNWKYYVILNTKEIIDEIKKEAILESYGGENNK